MEMVKASKAKARGQSDRMSLEDYLLLVQSHSHHHLTVPHLNQIISIHGYKKLHKVPKKLLSEAVSTLALVEPSRSTLKQFISPLVITTLEDVVADLNDLNWQECCVTSIETLSSWKHAHSSSSSASAPPLTGPRDDAVQYSAQNQQSAPAAPDSSAYGGDSVHGGASMLSRASVTASPPKKLATKRKRKMRAVMGGGDQSVSYGSC